MKNKWNSKDKKDVDGLKMREEGEALLASLNRLKVSVEIQNKIEQMHYEIDQLENELKNLRKLIKQKTILRKTTSHEVWRLECEKEETAEKIMGNEKN
ncbi:MAG: hypothetical protein J6O73_05480 [Lachnospiraceae bacterium]|nr:hypothetical protein [Lachnospiraceae bacterium]